MSGCNGAGLPPILNTTVFNPLKYTPAIAEAEMTRVSQVLSNKSEFMIDKRNETTSIKGHILRAKYSDIYGRTVAYIGYDDDAATLQGSIFKGMPMVKNPKTARGYFKRGGVACILSDKNHEKYALRLPYGKEVTVRGTVSELNRGWIYLKNCRFSSGKSSPEFKNSQNLDFLEGRWCAMSTGFMNKNVQWKVDYKKVEDNQFVGRYLYAKTYGSGWQNKGVETFVKSDKNLSRKGLNAPQGRFEISDKTKMYYYPNPENNKDMHFYLKCL